MNRNLGIADSGIQELNATTLFLIPQFLNIRHGFQNQPTNTRRRLEIMDRYVCSVCGYVYDPVEGDPEGGIEPGTKFEDLPDDWTCPVCGAEKDPFEKE